MIHSDSLKIWSSIHISVTVFKVQLAMLTNDSFNISPRTHTHIYIYILYIGSRQHPLHLSSCHCYGYRFWGGLSLSRVLWKSAYSRSNMKPKSIPRQARKWIEELFCWFQVLRQHSMFLSCCIHLHAYSFVFLSFACHVPFMLHSCPFISFLKLWKWLYGLAKGPSTINGYRSLISNGYR